MIHPEFSKREDSGFFVYPNIDQDLKAQLEWSSNYH